MACTTYFRKTGGKKEKLCYVALAPNNIAKGKYK